MKKIKRGTRPSKELESGFERLESELKRLKRLLKTGHELKLEWLPGRVKYSRGKRLLGEVLNGTIYIYNEEEEKALATLGHEFLDHMVCQVIEPYKSAVNRLIWTMNEEAYRKKEKLIERLPRALKLPDEDADWIPSNERRPSGGLSETAKAGVKRLTKPSERLESELERLKRALDIGYELGVKWHPGKVKHFHGKRLSGGILDGMIHIFAEGEEEAVSALWREFLDYAVCHVVEPYKNIADKLILIMSDETYRKKEGLIERLRKLVD